MLCHRRMLCTLALLIVSSSAFSNAAESRRPNVVLIMADDQGWGDLGFDGNTKIKTPNLDALARQSIVFSNFYVSPVCAPTRASLLTGRYNYRTGAIDTYRGRAMMHPEETTLAEMLAAAGYRTAIFGKWHLGDNYPLRPQDQGFQATHTLWGGGLVQWADPPQARGNSYINPWLSKNGNEKRFDGYCSDIFTDSAIEYIGEHRNDPFFVYLAYNCPHTPLEVREADWAPYKQAGLDETTAKVYGMVSNIDHNVGRLLKRLEELGLTDNTIVIFLTDNGPQQMRFNGQWRGLKGSVYEGGIHVPFFIRWPNRLKGGRTVEQPAAHIDVAPTLLSACGVSPPQAVSFDGRSLVPLIEATSSDWPDRNLFFQWHRGDVPELYRAFTVRGPRYKLVQAAGAGEKPPARHKFELFDLASDPGEQQDLSADKPEVVTKMKSAYEQWFRDVSSTRGYDPPAIHIGTEYENPVRLSRQDLRDFGPNEPGYWRVQFEAGNYRVKLLYAEGPMESANLKFDSDKGSSSESVHTSSSTVAGEATLSFRAGETGSGKLKAWIDRSGKPAEVQYAVFKRLP